MEGKKLVLAAVVSGALLAFGAGSANAQGYRGHDSGRRQESRSYDGGGDRHRGGDYGRQGGYERRGGYGGHREYYRGGH
ncbi:MAG TPA: hypothetical protein VFS34_09825 [Thermoanaerobaculia bacterium]|nr:hypothetical protein [Thermoanaerobaculia bacterium]